MRLYSGKIPTIAQDLIRKLKEEGDIEVSDVPEAQLDVEAVLKEYLRLDRELTEKAKDHMEKRRLPYEQLLKIKRSMAEERDIGIGDESVSYIANQILEAFMHSRFIDEVFGDDGDMPLVDAQTIDRLVAAFNVPEHRTICVPTFEGKRGNPVLWGRQHFIAIDEIEGDQGARRWLRAFR